VAELFGRHLEAADERDEEAEEAEEEKWCSSAGGPLIYCMKMMFLGDLYFFAEAEKPQSTNVLKWPQNTRLRQHQGRSQILKVRRI
jgi:hypothetical protein